MSPAEASQRGRAGDREVLIGSLAPSSFIPTASH